MQELKTIKIFKSFKDLDIEIRTIREDLDNDKKIHYVAEVGLYESLGEQGEILTLIYDNMPTEQEIITDTKQNLKETKEELSNSVLSGREERYLEILNKLEL